MKEYCCENWEYCDESPEECPIARKNKAINDYQNARQSLTVELYEKVKRAIRQVGG